MALLQKIIFGFQVTLACTLAMGCRADNLDPSNLTDHCAELSRNSEHQYFPMNAKILQSAITPPPPIHCDSQPVNSDCNKRKNAGWLYAIIETSHDSLKNHDDANGLIVVYTSPENRKELLKKPLYLQEGKEYSFCARGPEFHRVRSDFHIDHISSIIELK